MADGDNLVIGATNDSGLPTGLDRTAATPWTALLVTSANGSAVEAEAAAGGTGVAGTSSAPTNRARDASIAAAPCSIRSVSYP
jgi:hypothetical protein